MKKRLPYFLAQFLVATAVFIPFTFTSSIYAAENGEVVLEQLNQLIDKDPGLKGAISGVSIRSASTGAVLYQHMADTRLRPASNMKLLTAAAALSVLGKDYTFSTAILSDGKLKKKTLKGNLYLKGMGDPTLLKTDFDKMAADLYRLGIHKISGHLIGDDTWYDNIRYSSDVSWNEEYTYYGAQISALTASPDKDYDAGTVIVEVGPGKKAGDAAEVTVTPKNNFVKIVNHAATVASDEKKKITIEREHAKNVITISGNIPIQAKPEKEWIGVWDPTLFAASLLKQSLEKQGIQMTGTIKTGKTPENAQLLLTRQSIPLSELLVPFLKLSNNGHAEVLIKEMGRMVKGKGSWEKGLEVLKTEMAGFGLEPETMVFWDGSGLSHGDLITANQLSQLLYALQKEKWFPVFLHSLPVAGEKERMAGGTLRNRLTNISVKGKVMAKTGTINSVSTLSGYLTTKSGQTLIFSILLNNLLDESKGKPIEDRIVETLANY